MGAGPRVRVKVRGPDGWPSPPCRTSSPSLTRRSSGACPGLSFSQRAMTWRAVEPRRELAVQPYREGDVVLVSVLHGGQGGLELAALSAPGQLEGHLVVVHLGRQGPDGVPRRSQEGARAVGTPHRRGRGFRQHRREPGVPSARTARGSARGPAPRRTRQAPQWPGAAPGARGAHQLGRLGAPDGPPGRAPGGRCEASRDQGIVVLATATRPREHRRLPGRPPGLAPHPAADGASAPPPEVCSVGRVPAPVSRWRPMVVPAAPCSLECCPRGVAGRSMWKRPTGELGADDPAGRDACEQSDHQVLPAPAPLEVSGAAHRMACGYGTRGRGPAPVHFGLRRQRSPERTLAVTMSRPIRQQHRSDHPDRH